MEQTSWDLSKLLPDQDTKEYAAFMMQLDADITAFVEQKNTLKVEQLPQLVKQLDSIKKRLITLSEYWFFKTSQNVKDEQARLQLQKTEQYLATVADKLEFFTQWFISLPKEQVYEQIQKLGDDGYAFKRKYELAKHKLSEKEERIINLKDITGTSALEKLYDLICSSFVFDFEGKKQSLTQMRNYSYHKDRSVRKKAHELVHAKFLEYQDVLSEIYINIVRDFANESITLRNYASALSVRATAEDISEQAILTLMDVAQKNSSIFHDFFALKKRLMQVDSLELYDILAPLPEFEKPKVSYKDAFAAVVEVTDTIDTSFTDIINRLANKGYIDSVYHPNKRGGAYCSSAPGRDSYVFMQYLGEENDMFTLAHELGHAIHGVLCKDKSSFSYHASIGVCESASTFMEEILMDKLLERSSTKQKIRLLLEKLVDYFATIQLQIFVSIHEQMVHTHDSPTRSFIDTSWADVQKQLFGPSVTISDSLITWSYRPHIFSSPFYCYNYGVGNMLAMLFLEMQKTDEDFFSKYTNYLQVGGSAGIVETAKVMGIDVEDANTWQKAYDVIKHRLEMLKTLVDEYESAQGETSVVSDK